MWRVLALLLLSLSPALAVEPALQADFGKPPGPGLRLIGDANVQDGVLKTRSQAGWQRSGIEIGPLPLQQATWTIEYDFRPVALGAQGQEFTGQSPSTHWYMCYVTPGGAINLHTRQGEEWKLRANAGKVIEVGKWYHAQVMLTATSIRYMVRANDGQEWLWDSGVIAVQDMGQETTALLNDEAPDDAAQTEWDNVRVTTDNAAAQQRLTQLAQEAERQRVHREGMLAMSKLLREQGISIIPTPQQVKLTGGSVGFGDVKIVADAGAKGAAPAVGMVIKERLGWPCKGGTTLKLVSWPAKQKAPWANGQGYRLTVGKAGMQIAAATPEGLLYGAQTLCQLVTPDGERRPTPSRPVGVTPLPKGRGTANVPACEITDWPDIERRLVMIAIDQGAFQVVDVAYWQRIIRELAAVKINYIMPYFEGAGFFYEKYPFLALKGRDGFTIEKGKALSEYAWAHGIRLVPQQQTLGHAGSMLSHPELKHLAESGDVFCSSNPQTFAFIGDLFDELLQAFPHANYIHVGGDEFGHGFAKCDKCKARAEEIGKPGLYAEHMMRIHQMLADRKRGMMIWWHEQGYTEEAADRLAKDIAVFDWHYGNQSSYPSLQRLQEKGFVNTWATPAVTRYYDPGNDWNNTFGNISGFMAAGAQRKVPGECTCTWVHGIWGGRNMFELNLYGVVFSGQCAWNSLANDYGDFRWRFARQWFGVTAETSRGVSAEPTGAPRLADELDALMLQAMHEPYGVSKEQGFWRDNRVLEEMLAAPLAKTAEELAKRPELAAEAERLQGFCKDAYAAIEGLRQRATRNQVTLDFMAHDVHIHDTLARRILLTRQLVELWPQLGALPVAERTAKLQPVLDGLKGLADDYAQMVRMFDRSILEAGGGRCVSGGWPADGGIIFRAQQGRTEMLKATAYVEQALQAEQWPSEAFPK